MTAKKIRLILLLLFPVSFFSGVYAQKALLKGKITGEQGNLMAGVLVYEAGNQKVNATTDIDGLFQLSVDAERKVRIVISSIGYKKDTLTFLLKKDEIRNVNHVLSLIIQNTFEVVDKSDRKGFIQRIDPRITQNMTGPGDAIAMTLKSFAWVKSNSELSSQYSVRGGNFDENLVYVNDVEIYRPFLVRAGQQEGLSFANPDMIEGLKFSGGGFEAKYGDKMSSVLDITYKRPTGFHGSIGASVLGGNLQLEGSTKNYRLSGMIGARYRTTQYLLNSLDVQGQYRPAFTDVQAYLLYNITDKWDIDLLSNYAVNNYRVFPQSQRTEFGTINQALQLRVFFDGKEQSRFATSMAAITSTWKPRKNIRLKFITSAFNSSETERSDVMGQYFIDELERDIGKDNFGDVAFNRGIGSYITFIRNRLDYLVLNAEHKGYIDKGPHFFQYGLRAQSEEIRDRIKEWKMVDSADYSLPDFPADSIILNQVIRASASLSSMRYQAYAQYNYEWLTDSLEWSLTGGLRANHWTLNGQTIVSPRLVFSLRPLNWKRDITFRAAAGHYAQPPFYRELRGFDGSINPNVKAQESWHFIAGTDFTFKSWGRPFSLYAEVYYKILRNLVPYEVDNVRIRYFADNLSDGYAAGFDMKVNGEFVKGVQSWASISLMKTMEDIRNDFYYDYYDSLGRKIIPGYSSIKQATDSVKILPGYIPRPTDQRFNFSLFFQDYLPKNPTLSMQITLVFGSRLPMGPPDNVRYRDTLRIPAYRRVDIGFSKHFITKDRKLQYKEHNSFLKHFNSLVLSLEVFNLLGINNTVSYLWIKDVTNRTYGVPNFLTNRLINLRLQASF
jgi:hypothetical protein